MAMRLSQPWVESPRLTEGLLRDAKRFLYSANKPDLAPKSVPNWRCKESRQNSPVSRMFSRNHSAQPVRRQ